MGVPAETITDARAKLPHMPAHHDPTQSGFGTARFKLKVGEASIDASAQLPEGVVSPAVLLPVLQNLSNSLCELTIRNAEKLGERLSCRAGCGACCRQAVPITRVEARVLALWIDAQPEERRTELRERFRAAAARLEESGIAQAVRDSQTAPRDAIYALGLQYFALGIPCPFLEDEQCSIHEFRPLRCREYMVVSPPEYCAHPHTKQIVGIRAPVALSHILGRWDASGDAGSAEVILLTMLDEWVARNPPENDRAHRTAPELLQEFLHAFARDAQDAPADPRESAPAGESCSDNLAEN